MKKITTLKIKIAECPIIFYFDNKKNIICLEKLKKYFNNFRTKNIKKPYYRIYFSNNKKNNKPSEKNFYLDYKTKLNKVFFVVRNILRRYLKNKGFFLHCSANLLENKFAIIFLGNSGAGKTTVSNLLNKKYKKIIDDVAIIIKKNNFFYIYQTPFTEKNIFVKKNKGYKIKSVFILKKNNFFTIYKEHNHIRNLFKLLKQLWIDKKYLSSQTTNAIVFIKKIPFYNLTFAINRKKLIELFSDFYKHL